MHMAAYEADRASASERKSRSAAPATARPNMTLLMLIGRGHRRALGALEGGLADSDYDPHKSARMIVDRCMKNRGYDDPQRPRGIGG